MLKRPVHEACATARSCIPTITTAPSLCRHEHVSAAPRRRAPCAQIMCAISEKGERPEAPSEAPGALAGGAFPGFPAYCALMRRCWAEDPDARPPFEAVIAELRTLLADSSAHARRASGERAPKPPVLVPRLTVPGARARGAARAACACSVGAARARPRHDLRKGWWRPSGGVIRAGGLLPELLARALAA